MSTTKDGKRTGKARKVDVNFPVKLHYGKYEVPSFICNVRYAMCVLPWSSLLTREVLGELERDGLAHIASWQPHGRCFVSKGRRLSSDRIGSLIR